MKNGRRVVEEKEMHAQIVRSAKAAMLESLGGTGPVSQRQIAIEWADREKYWIGIARAAIAALRPTN